MAENEPESEQQVRKKVIYETSSRDTSRSMVPTLIIIAAVVIVLVIFIFTRIR